MTKFSSTRLPRLLQTVRADDGISIVEVLAAVVIFMILSVGVMQATVTSIRLAADQRHRVTAVSLATSDIDTVRAFDDPFDVEEAEYSLTIGEITYSVERDIAWVDGNGNDVACTTAGTGGNLQVLRVNVAVDWSSRLSHNPKVESDTVLAPDGRINDPTRGTILIGATRGTDGQGTSGVGVTVTPVSGGGGAVLDAQPPNTDAQGCSYALQVLPGKYTVTLSRTGYLDPAQVAAPTKTVDVTAGATVAVPFTYEAAGTYVPAYAPMEGRPSSVRFAKNNETTYISTFGVSYISGAPSSVPLFPWSSGYTPIAGHYVAPDVNGEGGCRALDPGEWSEAVVGGVALAAGVGATPAAALPGGSTSIDVPMGIVEVRNVRERDWVIARAVDGSSVPGVPSCSTSSAIRYAFANLSGSSSSGTRYLALPYGTWQISTSTSEGSNGSSANPGNLSPYSNVVKPGMVSGNVVVVDPRRAA